MAQKDHLPKLTSCTTGVAPGDVDIFIDMLETRWVRGIKAQQSGCSSAGVIKSVRIHITDAPRPHSVPVLLRRICEIQGRLKLEGAKIELVDVDFTLNPSFRESCTRILLYAYFFRPTFVNR